MSMLIGACQAAVGAAAQYDVVPPVGQAWCVVDVGSDQPPTGVITTPNLQLEICDGAHNDAILVLDPNTALMPASDKGIRKKEIYITNTDYLGIVNTAAGAAIVSWTGYRVSPNIVITDMYTVPASALLDVTPPAGQTWRITELAVQAYSATFHGDVTVRLSDGVALVSQLLITTMTRGWDKLLNWYIDDGLYLTFLDTSTANNDIAVVGTLEAKTVVGAVNDVAGGANWDVVPPAGQEWVVTEVSAETWAGAGGILNVPDVIVGFYDGASFSTVLDDGGAGGNPVSERWNSEMELFIDNAFYLRFTNGAVGNNEIGYCGYLRRQYA